MRTATVTLGAMLLIVAAAPAAQGASPKGPPPGYTYCRDTDFGKVCHTILNKKWKRICRYASPEAQAGGMPAKECFKVRRFQTSGAGSTPAAGAKSKKKPSKPKSGSCLVINRGTELKVNYQGMTCDEARRTLARFLSAGNAKGWQCRSTNATSGGCVRNRESFTWGMNNAPLF